MRLKLKKISIDAGRPVVFMHEHTAQKLNVHVGDRVEVIHKKTKLVSILDTVKGILGQNEVALSHEIIDYENIKDGEFVEVNIVPNPLSATYISKKMHGVVLSKNEIYSIVKDIVNNALTEAEIAYFVLSVTEKGMSKDETLSLIEAIYKTGKVISWDKGEIIVDKHSIGGIAGNRTTPIVVSICAASGILMPKTSSRAITSAAGTADTLETVTRVEFPADELKRIVRKAGACLAWGGSLGLAPADDKLIRVERILNLDPESQLIASILAKKLAVGSRYVLIDIPFGPGAKVSKSEAKSLGKKFILYGKHFGLKVRVVLTSGKEPIGNGIGPILEMQDVIKVLKQQNTPKDLERKSIFLAGQILEMVGKAKKGKGESMAKKILTSGQAYRKFIEIISTQGRKNSSLRVAKFHKDYLANRDGKIMSMNNKSINISARMLGCPADIGAGIYLFKHSGEKVRKGDRIATFYSESESKLKETLNYFASSKAVSLQ